VKGRDPVRIVLTQSLQVPVEARVMDPSRGRVLIFYPEPGDEERVSALEMAGAQLRSCKRDPRGGVDLDSLLGDLASMGISSVLVEGGARVLTSFLKARQFQRVVCFVAPILLGEGKRAVDDLGVEEVSQALRFSSARPRRVGTDLLWELEGPES
jgi:Pyrimidine reductase, riboflavin biosynthesis